MNIDRRVALAFIIMLSAAALYTYQSQDENYVLFYGFKVVNKHPHDSTAFTQGLVYFDGVLYEGTGLYGDSSIRIVELETGEVLKSKELSPDFFGEGVTILGEAVYQVTWRENTGFVYDLSLEELSVFQIPNEGWGLTENGTHIFLSDGSSALSIIDPETIEVIGSVEVLYDDEPVSRLNELEYINGMIFANIWQTDSIVIIDPSNGKVVSWIDLSGLSDELDRVHGIDVLNGIAYDEENDRLFVTGKLWSNLFEIKLIPK
jgi:glutamine cyclotransferase